MLMFAVLLRVGESGPDTEEDNDKPADVVAAPLKVADTVAAEATFAVEASPSGAFSMPVKSTENTAFSNDRST